MSTPGTKKQLAQTSKKSVRKSSGTDLAPAAAALALDIGRMIETARTQLAQTANAALTTLYWQIGTRIREDVLKGRRSRYGAGIVSALGRHLEGLFGRGFGEKSLRHMLRFAEAFPDFEIVSALRRQLTWTHFKQLIYLDDPLKRDFYVEMCRIQGWSTRLLQKKVDSMLYERTALSSKPEKLIREEFGRGRAPGGAEVRPSPEIE